MNRERERRSVCYERISSMNDNGLTRTFIHSYAEHYVNDWTNKVLFTAEKRFFLVHMCSFWIFSCCHRLRSPQLNTKKKNVRRHHYPSDTILLSLPSSFLDRLVLLKKIKMNVEILLTLLKAHLNKFIMVR